MAGMISRSRLSLDRMMDGLELELGLCEQALELFGSSLISRRQIPWGVRTALAGSRYFEATT